MLLIVAPWQFSIWIGGPRAAVTCVTNGHDSPHFGQMGADRQARITRAIIPPGLHWFHRTGELVFLKRDPDLPKRVGCYAVRTFTALGD